MLNANQSSKQLFCQL